MNTTNFRRLLAAALCLVMLLSLLTACSKKNADNQTAETTGTPQATTPTDDGTTGSTYTAPIENYIALENAKTWSDYEALLLNWTGGLYKDLLGSLSAIKKNASEKMDEWEVTTNTYKEVYGEDYEFYYVFNDKATISADDLKIIEEELQAQAEKELVAIDTILGDYAMLETFALTKDLTNEQMKDILGLYESIYKQMKTAKISEGYELDVTYYVKGSLLDEPQEDYNATVTVCKIDGKWVDITKIYLTSFAFSVSSGNMDVDFDPFL